MATNTVKVTLQIRHDEAQDWVTRNPVLAAGEYGLESDTFLIKVGDGVRDWEHLPYLNKLDTRYFKLMADGSLTFSDSFAEDLEVIHAITGDAIEHLTITDPPVNPTDAVNKQYVDEQILAANHLRRAVVDELPTAAEADENTLYMMLSQDGTHYDEYMVINGVWDVVGATGDGSGTFTLEVATHARLGGVKSAPLDSEGKVMTDKDYVIVDNAGFMTFNQVSTSKLYVPTGDVLVIYGGTA